MMPMSRHEICGRAKVGAIAGIAGGLGLVVSFFGIDAGLRLLPGSFYMMIGLAVGLHGTTATIFGGLVHMLTAAAIGAGFSICSSLHPWLHIRSVWKGVFAGGVTGLEVYAIFFMPITLYLMIPTIDGAVSDSFTGYEIMVLAMLKSHMTMIIWGALVLHVAYGTVMGFFTYLLSGKVQKDTRKTLRDIESESMPAT